MARRMRFVPETQFDNARQASAATDACVAALCARRMLRSMLLSILVQYTFLEWRIGGSASCTGPFPRDYSLIYCNKTPPGSTRNMHPINAYSAIRDQHPSHAPIHPASQIQSQRQASAAEQQLQRRKSTALPTQASRFCTASTCLSLQ